MDRNTVIGIVLIIGILIGFSYLNKPSQEEIEATKHRQDSVAQVELAQQAEAQLRAKELADKQATAFIADTTVEGRNAAADRFGAFATGATGVEKLVTLENNLMKVVVSTKGGKIYSVELKNYKTYDDKPLVLFSGDENKFGLSFFTQNNRSINTNELYFTPNTDQPELLAGGPEVKKGKEGNVNYNEDHPGTSQTLTMRLDAGEGRALEYVYTVDHNSYMVGFNIKTLGLADVVAANANVMDFTWAYAGPRLEKKSQFGEERYTSVNFKFLGDDVEKLDPAKTSEQSLATKVKWISFKQLFFNSTIIADDAFPAADIKYTYDEHTVDKVGDFSAAISIPYDRAQDQAFGMRFYFGPNHFSTLNQYDLDMDRLVNLGYSVLRWVNRYLVIPVFNTLRNYIDNFGIIILLLTIVIKLILFPFTYKSYLSQAKMRALKPEVDELNAKFGTDKPMEKQQATMALYKKAGVNPLGGCLPMLLQMPILFAMFFFFPTSIELRQESFLWAHDLSSYDSILSLPFSIPFYGDHVSLFCLLMTITTIISTKLNSQATSSNAMPGMQTMMYLMPIMFLFILNNYPAGLSYYYFLANLITIGQMYLFRLLIDDEKIRAQLHANKKKPVTKSKFQQRIEQMAKERGVQLPK